MFTSIINFFKSIFSSNKTTTNSGAKPVAKRKPPTTTPYDLIPNQNQTVNAGGQVQFRGTGGTPPYYYSIYNNLSGAVITNSGLYTAGNTATGSNFDNILGSDSKGNKSYTGVYVVAAPGNPPPPSSNGTVGLVTNFKTVPDSEIFVDGHPYEVNTPGKPYSMTLVDPTTLRFELRHGDRYCTSNYCDGTDSERSEISDYKDNYAAGTTWNFKYKFMVEPGSAVTSDWCLLGQLHDVGPGDSPPFATLINPGDKMAFQIGWLRQYISSAKSFWDTTVEGKQVSYGYSWVDPNPLQRGHWYDMDITVRLTPSGGLISFVRDGVEVHRYTGPLGFGYKNKWEHGIYRNTSAETLSVNYRDFRFTNSAG